MAFFTYSLYYAIPYCCFIFLLNLIPIRAHNIPSTLDGPFTPVTVPYDTSLRGKAVDIPDTDPRVCRRVKGFQPEQISLSLSTSFDSVWISWITGSLSFPFIFIVINQFSSLRISFRCMTLKLFVFIHVNSR